MEGKKEYWQQSWWKAGFKTEDEWLNWWVSMLEKGISETQFKLNHLRKEPWESEIQLANFIQYLCEYTDRDHDYCAIARVISMSIVKDSKENILSDVLVLDLRGHNGKFYKRNVKDFLLSYAASGNKWHEVAKETSKRIEEILTIAEKIRRNLLYPEVEELERKIMGLESQNLHLEKLLVEAHGFHDKTKSQLAEKEKEIENLYEAIEKAIIALDQTKKMFKSRTIAQIRKDLTNALSPEKQAKFIGIQPSEPWPRK